MNHDPPLPYLPPRDPEAQELFERQLASCGAETMLETGNLVDGEWWIRVCPRCYSMKGNMGAPNKEGCMEHGIAEWDFIRVRAKLVAADSAVGLTRSRPSPLAGSEA